MIRPELKYGIDESYRWWGRLEGGGLRVICHQHPKPMSTVEIERAVKERGLGAVWDYHPPCPVDYARSTLWEGEESLGGNWHPFKEDYCSLALETGSHMHVFECRGH